MLHIIYKALPGLLNEKCSADNKFESRTGIFWWKFIVEFLSLRIEIIVYCKVHYAFSSTLLCNSSHVVILLYNSTLLKLAIDTASLNIICFKKPYSAQLLYLKISCAELETLLYL
jgi:hypothetical protein